MRRIDIEQGHTLSHAYPLRESTFAVSLELVIRNKATPFL
jgi:hypothetical protein